MSSSEVFKYEKKILIEAHIRQSQIYQDKIYLLNNFF